MKYTRLFPKVAIYKDIKPKYIPTLAGQNAEGYSEYEQMEIGEILFDLRQQNSGKLPKITKIGSYSGRDNRCIVVVKNTGKYSPEWFENKVNRRV